MNVDEICICKKLPQRSERYHKQNLLNVGKKMLLFSFNDEDFCVPTRLNVVHPSRNCDCMH